VKISKGNSYHGPAKITISKVSIEYFYSSSISISEIKLIVMLVTRVKMFIFYANHDNSDRYKVLDQRLDQGNCSYNRPSFSWHKLQDRCLDNKPPAFDMNHCPDSFHSTDHF